MKKLIPLLLLAVMLTAGCGPISLSTTGQQPTINSFEAIPPMISAGESSTLKWDVSGATKVSIDQGIDNVALTGSRAVMPSATTVYTLTATNAAGVSVPATAQVIVSGAAPPTPTPTPPPAPTPTPTPPEIAQILNVVKLPVISQFIAEPDSIAAGGSSKLSWQVYNVTSVSISPDIGTVDAKGSILVNPTTTTVYTLQAVNNTGSSQRQLTVTVEMSSTFAGTLAALAKPDLEVDKEWVIFSMETDPPRDLMIRVKNNGPVAAPASRAEAIIDGLSTAIVDIPALPPRTTSDYYSMGVVHLVTGHLQSIVIIVDRDNWVNESNESNNRFTYYERSTGGYHNY